MGALKIPGMQKALKDANQKLRRSDREKKIVERFGYGVKACEGKHYYSYLAGKMTTAK